MCPVSLTLSASKRVVGGSSKVLVPLTHPILSSTSTPQFKMQKSRVRAYRHRAIGFVEAGFPGSASQSQLSVSDTPHHASPSDAVAVTAFYAMALFGFMQAQHRSDPTRSVVSGLVLSHASFQRPRI